VFAAVTKFAQIMPHLLRSIVASMVLIVTVSGGESRTDWPEHAITIIVPFARSGVTDLIGRLLATELTQRLGRIVSVQNRAGEVGRDALRDVAIAAPNGYTLLVTTNAALINLVINPNLSKTSYDTLKDFAPIAYLGSTPLVIVTRPSSGIGSIADLIAKAKANPGKLSCATVGVGSPSGIVLDLLKIRAGIDITDTPFDGNELAMMAATTGATDVASLGLGGSVNYIRSGELKALAQTGSDRWVDLPDVPTMAEAGIPNTVVETSLMFFAPAGTPDSVIDRLTRLTQEILQQRDIQARTLDAGIRVQYEGPEDLYARMIREISIWKEVAKRPGVKKR
jgi:tripartite-type tricarboxylate transporter receptor subunit TctC